MFRRWRTKGILRRALVSAAFNRANPTATFHFWRSVHWVLPFLVGKDVMKKLYDKATEKPYGFLLILLTETDKNKQFYGSFETRLVPT